MASFIDTIASFEKIFSEITWTANAIPTYPSNVSLTAAMPSEYVVLEVLPGKPKDDEFSSAKHVAGVFIAQIYTGINIGPRRVYQISDLIDDVLNKQLLENNVQTGSSWLDVKGNDPDDSSLFRADYSLSFNSF